MKKKISAFIVILLLCGCTNIEDPPVVSEKPSSAKETSASAEETLLEDPDDTGADFVDAFAETTDISEEITAVNTSEPSSPLPPEIYTVRLLCAGDNLIHTPIYRSAHEVTGGNGYDFMPSYKHLGTLISDPDLAILNQETIISDDFAPDTYPFFCTPSEMARDMIALGFDAFSVSNNHVLDKGEAGLISTLNFWRNTYPGVPVYGAYLNEDDMNDIRTLEVNGITFAFLGYMEHTNGLSLPPDSQCRVTYLSQEELIEQQIRRAAEIADCVVVSAHFGIEVSNIITVQQYKLSQKFADWGADIIIGTQPHTIQSMEYLDAADGRKAFVFYCLGNFISTMDNPLSMAEILGEITVTKQPGECTVTLSDPEAIPLVDHYDRAYSYVGVYPLDQYTPELAAAHAVEGVSYEQLLSLFRQNIPEEYFSQKYRDIIFS